MPSFSTRRQVPFSARQMFDIVADVEKYPLFLPMCTGLTVLSRTPKAAGDELTATMSVGYKNIAESFTTRVQLRPQDNKIDVAYLNGPFKRLDNNWAFVDQPGGGSIIDFYISYEFKSPLLGALVGAVFDKAFRKFAEAFEERARIVYGRSASA